MKEFERKKDEELVTLSQNGNRQAMDELVCRYANLVRGRARGYFLVDGETDDLMQEGMIGLYGAIMDYNAREGKSFKNFAYMCVRRRIIDAVKRSASKKNQPLNTSVPLSIADIWALVEPSLDDEMIMQDENVRYALKMNKATREGSKEKAREELERVGLGNFLDKKPYELSGGQQQRVAIARTLVLNPDIILFDEPMSALDVATRLSLRREIKQIQKEYGTTMIYITHDQEEAFAMSDRIMVMNEAKLVQIDTPENIIKNPANDYVKTFVIDNLRQKIDSLSKYAKVDGGEKA